MASNLLILVPCSGGLPREAHPEVLGREPECVRQFQSCGTRRKFEPRRGQKHGHVCGPFPEIYHLCKLCGLKEKTDEATWCVWPWFIGHCQKETLNLQGPVHAYAGISKKKRRNRHFKIAEKGAFGKLLLSLLLDRQNWRFFWETMTQTRTFISVCSIMNEYEFWVCVIILEYLSLCTDRC